MRIAMHVEYSRESLRASAVLCDHACKRAGCTLSSSTQFRQQSAKQTLLRSARIYVRLLIKKYKYQVHRRCGRVEQGPEVSCSLFCHSHWREQRGYDEYSWAASFLELRDVSTKIQRRERKIRPRFDRMIWPKSQKSYYRYFIIHSDLKHPMGSRIFNLFPPFNRDYSRIRELTHFEDAYVFEKIVCSWMEWNSDLRGLELSIFFE